MAHYFFSLPWLSQGLVGSGNLLELLGVTTLVATIMLFFLVGFADEFGLMRRLVWVMLHGQPSVGLPRLWRDSNKWNVP